LLPTTAKITPGLANNWHQADHTGDSNAAVVALPNTIYGVAGTTVSAKSKTASCTGTVSDGTNTASITSAQVTLSQASAAVDNPPLQEPGTCSGLLAGTQPGDVGAKYNATIKFKATGAKLANATISNATIDPDTVNLGFAIGGGTTGGSITGGNSKAHAYIGADTIGALATTPSTSASPAATSPCEASLKVKAASATKPASAKLKKPKGLKKIPTVANSLVNNAPSTICIKLNSGTCA